MKFKKKDGGSVLFDPKKTASIRHGMSQRGRPEHPLAESFARWRAIKTGYLRPGKRVV